MPKAYITGWKGFIGRHFTAKLLEMGWDVDGCDIKDGVDCRDWFKTANEVYDLIVHAAAIVGGRMLIDNNPLQVATDLSIDAEMFNWAVKTKQKKVVYFSSCAAYPTSVQEINAPTSENALDLENIKLPDKTYGWSKLTGEILAGFARKYGVEVFVVRPYSGYDGDQDMDYPITTFLKRIDDRQNPFEIWGDGEQVRDWIYIDDLVDAILAMIKANEYGPVNLCTGIGTSINGVVDKLFDIVGWRPAVKHLLDKPTGPRYRIGNPSKMNKFYTAKISLEDGLKKSIEMWKKRLV